MIGAVSKYSIERHIECLDRLEEDANPVFGSLDARGMMRHLRFSFDSSIGDPEAEDDSKPVLRTILWILFFNIFTEWPGGKIKAPPSVTPAPEHDFVEERRMLIDAMRRFVTKLESDPDEKHVNPGLGPLSMTQWSHLHGIHNHHHYKQFQLEEHEEEVA